MSTFKQIFDNPIFDNPINIHPNPPYFYYDINNKLIKIGFAIHPRDVSPKYEPDNPAIEYTFNGVRIYTREQLKKKMESETKKQDENSECKKKIIEYKRIGRSMAADKTTLSSNLDKCNADYCVEIEIKQQTCGPIEAKLKEKEAEEERKRKIQEEYEEENEGKRKAEDDDYEGGSGGQRLGKNRNKSTKKRKSTKKHKKSTKKHTTSIKKRTKSTKKRK